MLGRYMRNFAILFAAVAAVMACQSDAFCQVGGNNGGGNNAGGNAGGNAGTQNGVGQGGVEIDAEGVLSARILPGNARMLNKQQFEAAKASLNKDLQKPSNLRKVSLTRLEKEVKRMLEAGEDIPMDMKYLAGLTRITHVFFYPESKDIVIAGPAEGCFVSANNHVIGMKTGRATLQLQDLIVALRCFDAQGNKTPLISCSIDPTQEGLANFTETYTRIAKSGQFRAGREIEVMNAYRNALGMQRITINGVSPKTHFARVLAEADVEMKMIGVGLKQAPVKITSFIEKAKATSGSSLTRWFFQPEYDCVSINEDGSAMELVGNGVKLVGEDESVNKAGERVGKGRASRASQVFCTSFTRMYPKLAEKAPLWGELRNVIDLSIVAAFIQKMDLYNKADWNMETFGDESVLSVETLSAPTQVPPVANGVWKGRHFMSPIAGGVNIQPRVALNSDRMKVDSEGTINKVKNEIKLDGLAEGQWWWD